MTMLEEKIHVIADEVLDILKQLSQDNMLQLNASVLAERMFARDAVKTMLTDSSEKTTETRTESDLVEKTVNDVLKKISDLNPLSAGKQMSNAKDHFQNKTTPGCAVNRLDSTIEVIKEYHNYIIRRNKELEEFIQQTMQHLEETESHLALELSFHQQKYSEDRDFENSISTNIHEIKRDFSVTDDIQKIKMAVLSKIENINKGIERKRELDMERFRELESTLESMGRRIRDIKIEADEIKKKAHESEIKSLRDNLTGLYNRRAYDQKIIETLANLQRYNVQSSLIVCDIDHFKKTNDAFGHKVGDLALKKLANLLIERLRISDFISRYGGDEFAIILPHTELGGAEKAAEDIRSYIDRSVFSYKGSRISLTISIGVSTFQKEDNCNSVFERADQALYFAKRSGRNTVKTEKDVINESIIADPDTISP